MPDDTNYGMYLIIALLFTLPPVIVFVIATIIRVRRSKFQRQRVPSRSKKELVDEDETET
jgi:hypothetical protein